MSATSTSNRVVIVGGGISGLATAFYLAKRGIRPVLIEKQARLGGLIHTDRIDSCDLEAGPDSFIAAKTSVKELAAELGIADQILGSNDAARKIRIVRDGRLQPMPKGMSFMVPGDLRAAGGSPLFTWSTKAGFFAELLHGPKHRSADISIRDFVTEHFTKEVLDYVAEPLLSGVYGGDVAALSARSVLPRFVEYEAKYGSLIRGVRAQTTATKGSLFLSFEGGMQTLVDALVSDVDGNCQRVEAEALSVQRVGDEWEVRHSAGSTRATHVVLACPAYANADLLQEERDLAALLRGIPYSSAILTMLVYDRNTLGHALDGFGFLVPKPERRAIAAATWVSTKFPSRTPENRAALRAFIVGDQAGAMMTQSDEEILAALKAEFSRLMGVSTEPLFHTLHRWPKSMPQYVVGHQARVDKIKALLAQQPGLYLCGNAYEGVGIPDCVRMAQEVSGAISREH